jgi:hypothetical protein
MFLFAGTNRSRLPLAMHTHLGRTGRIGRSNFQSALALSVLLSLPACKSSERVKQETVGLATVSAMAVALPLIPFAMPYGAITSAREEKQKRKLEEVLDPVYEQRRGMVTARDPVADAAQAWTNGARAFLPSLPRANIFPGLENTEFHLKQGNFASENYARIMESEFLRYLETLMGQDPVHVQNSNVLYFSATYKQFLKVTWDYRERFNRETHARQTAAK